MASSKTALSKNISIPRPLCETIDKKLSVDGQGRTVPRGSYSALITSLLEAWTEGRVNPRGERLLGELGK